MFKLDPKNPMFAEDVFSKYTESFVHKRSFYRNRALVKFVNQTKANMMDFFSFIIPSMRKKHEKTLEFSDIPSQFYMEYLSVFIEEKTLDDFKLSDKFKEKLLDFINSCKETNKENNEIKEDEYNEEVSTAFAMFTEFHCFGEPYTSKEALTVFLYLCGIFKKDFLPVTVSLNELCDRMLIITAKEYLMSKSVEEKDLKENNILEYVPQYPHELLEFYKRFFLYFVINIDRIASILAITKNMHEYFHATDNEFEKTMKEMTKKQIELEDENKEVKREKALLESKVNELTELNQKSNEKTKEENNTLKRENKALAKEVERLKQQMYKSKTEQKKEKKKEVSTNVPQEPVYKDMKFDGHYLFVLYDDNTFIPDLKEAFPNTIFTGSNMNLENFCLDCIVVFTGHISHSAYLPIKQQAKNKNIPLLYSHSTNIDKVKKLIFENIG